MSWARWTPPTDEEIDQFRKVIEAGFEGREVALKDAEREIFRAYQRIVSMKTLLRAALIDAGHEKTADAISAAISLDLIAVEAVALQAQREMCK